MAGGALPSVVDALYHYLDEDSGVLLSVYSRPPAVWTFITVEGKDVREHPVYTGTMLIVIRIAKLNRNDSG